GIIAQNFAQTAHRLDWIEATGAVRVTLEWSWAARVFSRLGVAPRWHTPITHSWFQQYFEGRNLGPALEQPQLLAGETVQCFRGGCAIVQRGTVSWMLSPV